MSDDIKNISNYFLTMNILPVHTSYQGLKEVVIFDKYGRNIYSENKEINNRPFPKYEHQFKDAYYREIEQIPFENNANPYLNDGRMNSFSSWANSIINSQKADTEQFFNYEYECPANNINQGDFGIMQSYKMCKPIENDFPKYWALDADDRFDSLPLKDNVEFNEQYYEKEINEIKVEKEYIESGFFSNIAQLTIRCRDNINLLEKEVKSIKLYKSLTNLFQYNLLKEDIKLSRVNQLLKSFKLVLFELNKLINYKYPLNKIWDSSVYEAKELLKSLLGLATKSADKLISRIKSILTKVIIYQKERAKKYKLIRSWLLSYLDFKSTLKEFRLKGKVNYFLILNFLKDEFKIYKIHSKLQTE